MVRRFVGAVLITIGMSATSALAATSAIHPALSQNPAERPKKVVLLPPQIFVFDLSAGVPAARLAPIKLDPDLISSGDREVAFVADRQPHATLVAPTPGHAAILPYPATGDLATEEKSEWPARPFDCAPHHTDQVNAADASRPPLQGIMDRPYSEFKDRLAPHLRDTFALPNGDDLAGLVGCFAHRTHLAPLPVPVLTAEIRRAHP